MGIRESYGEYFQSLHDRVGAAVAVPFLEMRAGSWLPRMNDCHNNADFYVRHHLACTAVGGRLSEPGFLLSSQASVSSLVGSRHDWTSRHFGTPRFRLEVLLFAIQTRHPGDSDYRASDLLKGLRAPWRICRTSTRLGFSAIR